MCRFVSQISFPPAHNQGTLNYCFYPGGRASMPLADCYTYVLGFNGTSIENIS